MHCTPCPGTASLTATLTASCEQGNVYIYKDYIALFKISRLSISRPRTWLPKPSQLPCRCRPWQKRQPHASEFKPSRVRHRRLHRTNTVNGEAVLPDRHSHRMRRTTRRRGRRGWCNGGWEAAGSWLPLTITSSFSTPSASRPEISREAAVHTMVRTRQCRRSNRPQRHRASHGYGQDGLG